MTFTCWPPAYQQTHRCTPPHTYVYIHHIHIHKNYFMSSCRISLGYASFLTLKSWLFLFSLVYLRHRLTMTLGDQAALELTIQGAFVSQVLGLIRNLKTGNKTSFQKYPRVLITTYAGKYFQLWETEARGSP